MIKSSRIPSTLDNTSASTKCPKSILELEANTMGLVLESIVSTMNIATIKIDVHGTSLGTK